MNCRRLLSALACLLTSLALLSPASAQSGAEAEAEINAQAGKTRVDLSVGLKGGLAMSAVTEVPELNVSQYTEYGPFPRSGDDSGYFGAFGLGPAIGLSLEGRVMEIFGLETGFYYSQDNATGRLDKEINGINAGRINSDQETSALHIPVLLKLISKSDMVKPFFGLGVEFVLQQSSSISYRSDDAAVQGFVETFEARNTITTSNYTLLQLTTGVEIDLGEIRIPIELRGGYNLGYDDSFSARVDPQEQPDGSYEFVYDGGYMGNFGVFVGVMYDFELYL